MSKANQRPSTLPSTSPAHISQKSALVKIGDTNDFLSVSGKALGAYDGIFRSFAARDTYENYETNISLRDQFTRDDYEYFRPNEKIPQKPEDIIRACRNAYRRVGIIRNIMDLMADFGAQGAKLVHPNQRIQKFYRGWFNKVGGKRICERFLNLLYREGVAVLKRTMGKLPKSSENRIRAMGEKLEPDSKIEDELQTSKRNIPLRYNFLNPLSLKANAPELSQFVGKQLYSLKVSYNLRRTINHPKTKAEKQLVDMIADDIKSAIKQGANEIPLDPTKIIVKFYKKDDWSAWADPMTYAIMDDIILLEKMKLADLAALDGAISQVRLWKLGDIEQGILPTAEAIDRLSDILMANPGGGAFDIIWGPDLTVEEYKTNVHQFLGKAKYEPVWNAIYEGLGVPPTLTGGSFGGSSGMTNNQTSLKTLIQRLEYGRDLLKEVWAQEIELVRQAMGFQIGAKLVFDNMVLSDEAAEKALLIQLIDRDLISVETVIDRFGELPEFEELKMRREEKARKKGLLKPKASPWHDPEKIYEFMKIALQRGYISPEQTGMDEAFPEEFMDVDTPFDKQMKATEQKNNQIQQKKHSDVPQKGRPKNSKDSEKRDQRTPKPLGASSASYITTLMWAKAAQDKISNILTPIILEYFGKKSVRSLSSDEFKKYENAKFNVLANLEPYSDINHDIVHGILLRGKVSRPEYKELYQLLRRNAQSKKDEELTVEENRIIQAGVYSAINCKELEDV